MQNVVHADSDKFVADKTKKNVCDINDKLHNEKAAPDSTVMITGL